MPAEGINSSHEWMRVRFDGLHERPARPADPFVVSINFSCYLLSVSFIDSVKIHTCVSVWVG